MENSKFDLSKYAIHKMEKFYPKWKAKVGDSPIMNERFLRVAPRLANDSFVRFIRKQSKFNLQGFGEGLSLKTYGDLTNLKLSIDDVSRSGYNSLYWEHHGDYSIASSGSDDLKGLPSVIIGSLDCSENNITSLNDGNMPIVRGGDIDLSMNPLGSLEGIQKEIDGSLFLGHCNLYSLQGAPKKIADALYASHNRLSNLIGCPDCDVLDVKYNLLESLEGAPSMVRAILASNNLLRTLKYCPYVTQDAVFSHNRLVSIADAPSEIGGEFFLDSNEIESLRGCPPHLKKSLRIENNRLRDLEGAPKRIDCDFVCLNNPLKSLEGIPNYIGGDLICEETPELSQAVIDHVQKKLVNAINEDL